MNNYHPDADPEFVAMDSHYQATVNENFLHAMHASFDELGFVSLDSDKRDFCFSLWKRGYKIVPTSQLPDEKLALLITDALGTDPIPYTDWEDGNGMPVGEAFRQLIEAANTTQNRYPTLDTPPLTTDDSQAAYNILP